VWCWEIIYRRDREVDEHRGAVQDWSMQIWQLLTLELWMQTFIDGGGNHAVADLMHEQQAATA
jgi:hypothetical protein